MPSIVQGLGRLWGSADFELDWDTSLFTTGDILLLIVLCVVLIPLGFAKRIDFLGFTSAIGMFAMMSFGKSDQKLLKYYFALSWSSSKCAVMVESRRSMISTVESSVKTVNFKSFNFADRKWFKIPSIIPFYHQ